MLVSKTIEIDMGHRVMNHKSKCKNPHGHRYKIEVGVDDKVIQTEGVSEEGMVIDFGDLKAIMMEEIHSRFDHGFTVCSKDEFMPLFMTMVKSGSRVNVVDFIPTAENMARHWFNLMEKPLKEKQIKLSFVRVWETPSSTATYTLTDKQNEKIVA